MATSRTRRRLTPDERRTELIDAATRLLESGAEVSNWVQAVTAEADAAKGTFYLYFASWEDMLVAVRDRVLRAYVTRFRDLTEATEPGGWWATLDAECDAAIDVIAQPNGLHTAIFHSSAALAPARDDLDLNLAIARFLQLGIDNGAFRAIDPHRTATLLFAILHAAGDAVLEGEEPERWRAAVHDLTRHWLAPPEHLVRDVAKRA